MSASVPAWQIHHGPFLLRGFAYGLRYPALVAILGGPSLDEAMRTRLTTAFRERIFEQEGVAAPVNSTSDRGELAASVELLLVFLADLQRAGGLPVFEAGRIVAVASDRAKICVPTMQQGAAAVAPLLQWLVAWFGIESRGEDSADHLSELESLRARLQKSHGLGTNVPRFVGAALNLQIPFCELPGQAIQYGQGRRSRWLDSSFTDATSHIGARLARNKLQTAATLRQSGIPAPEHRAVSSPEEALQVARGLGYPVVVKPMDLDGGVGVAAGLLSDDEVVQAFQAARQKSRHLLVERHIEANDYRVTVFQGKAIWAIERRPGGVTGDGRLTVRELVDKVNAEPYRGGGTHAALKRLELDEEALALLRRTGLEADSVPPDGEFVRLRRAANIASGGRPVAVYDRLHPDNAQLAVRAAAALRLDLAGIDLLLPDIARSWQETGGVVCEVNGQPNLGQTTAAHLYAPLLRRLVPASGRIPTAIVLGAAAESTLVGEVGRALLAQGIPAGCHDTTGVWIERDVLMPGWQDPFAAGQMLLHDQRSGAVVLSLRDMQLLATGLPFPRFDLLVLAGTSVTEPDGRRASPQRFSELLSLLLPACDGRIVNLAGSGLNIEGFSGMTAAAADREPTPREQAVNYLAEVLRDMEALHSRDLAPPAPGF